MVNPVADKRKPRKPAGPPPENLAADGDWREAMKVAVKKEKPAEGWPQRAITKRKITRGSPS